MQTHPRNYSKSANRALDVMDYFALVGGPARSADIADALGIARSSANQLLKTMVLDGYLVMSTDDKSYFPSLRMARFGHWLAGCYPALDRYRAIVDALHQETGEIVTLSMQNDCFMQVMGAMAGNDDDPILLPGGRVPVVGSAIGGAVLTTQPRKTIVRLIERARQRHLVLGGAPSGGDFLDEIRLFRMKGYAWAPTMREVTEAGVRKPAEFWSIAMTLPGEARTPGVVLGLSGPVRRVRGREWDLVNLMRRSIRLNLPH